LNRSIELTVGITVAVTRFAVERRTRVVTPVATRSERGVLIFDFCDREIGRERDGLTHPSSVGYGEEKAARLLDAGVTRRIREDAVFIECPPPAGIGSAANVERCGCWHGLIKWHKLT
jgi:hypothetical protein